MYGKQNVQRYSWAESSMFEMSKYAQICTHRVCITVWQCSNSSSFLCRLLGDSSHAWNNMDKCTDYEQTDTKSCSWKRQVLYLCICTPITKLIFFQYLVYYYISSWCYIRRLIFYYASGCVTQAVKFLLRKRLLLHKHYFLLRKRLNIT